MCGMFDWIIISPDCRVGDLAKYKGDRNGLQTKSLGSWLDTYVVNDNGYLLRYEHRDEYGSGPIPVHESKFHYPTHRSDFTGGVSISTIPLSMYFENGVLMDADYDPADEDDV